MTDPKSEPCFIRSSIWNSLETLWQSETWSNRKRFRSRTWPRVVHRLACSARREPHSRLFNVAYYENLPNVFTLLKRAHLWNLSRGKIAGIYDTALLLSACVLYSRPYHWSWIITLQQFLGVKGSTWVKGWGFFKATFAHQMLPFSHKISNTCKLRAIFAHNLETVATFSISYTCLVFLCISFCMSKPFFVGLQICIGVQF